MTTLAPFDQAKPAGLGSTMSSTPATGLATQTVTAATAAGGKDTCLFRRETSARAAPQQLRRVGERSKLRVARRMYAGGGGGVRPVRDGGRLLGAGDTQTMRQTSVSLALTFRRHCRGLCGRLACVCTCIRAHWRFGFVVRVVTPSNYELPWNLRGRHPRSRSPLSFAHCRPPFPQWPTRRSQREGIGPV